jgi:ketosteroid isomerase-like protein
MNEESERLADLFAEWSAAIVSNDRDSIGSFMADEWIIISPTGTTTRQQFLNAVSTGAVTHESFSFEPEQIRTYGDTAIASGRVRNNGMFKGAPFDSDEWASDVFVKQDGRWLCVLSHITPVSSETC